MTVRPLAPDDVHALVALRREALEEVPLAFASSPEDDRGSSPERMRATLARTEGSAVFGAFLDDALVGMTGIGRADKVKTRHNAWVWGMYVAPAARGRGLGAELLRAAVERAQSWPGIVQVQLGVGAENAAARRLYEGAGFRPWGTEPRALHSDGRFVDEVHLVLDLAGEAD